MSFFKRIAEALEPSPVTPEPPAKPCWKRGDRPFGSGRRVEERLSSFSLEGTWFKGDPTWEELEALAQLDLQEFENNAIKEKIAQLEERRKLERRYAELGGH